MRTKITLALLPVLGVAGLLMASGAIEPPAMTDAGAPASPEVAAPMPPGAARAAAMAAAGGGKKKEEFPKWADASKDYKKVVSTSDGSRSLYSIWTRKKDAQMLAELPSNYASQKLFIAFTVAGGTTTSGVQSGDMYAYWKRFDKRLALIEPNYAVRTTGDLESKKGYERVFTDRVILDVPIVTMGPGGGPVIDMDALLLGGNAAFRYPGANPRLAKIAKAKAFPKNVEIAFELPLVGGRLGTLHYSISEIPKSTGYKPRAADARIGYFGTTYRDVGHPGKDTPWVRYINRWKLQKADPKLSMSPPKEPIIFYLEHTTPVRYRRWVRDGVLEWNKAYEKVGIVNAVEVYQQDARTGAHMEKDPEDARYNFVLWTNAGMGFAIGPSRVDPRTGQILDADIVMDEGFISSWVRAWEKLLPKTAMLNYGPETLAWLQTRPQWDPRVRLAKPSQRRDLQRKLMRAAFDGHDHPFAGHPAANADPGMMGDDQYDGLSGRVSQVNGYCDYSMAAALEVALFRMAPELLAEFAERGQEDKKGAGKKEGKEKEDDESSDDDEESSESDGEESSESEGESDSDSDSESDSDSDSDSDDDHANAQKLDGLPEWFVGPMLKGIIMHEVGHTLGLRHNFKASTVYSLEEINSPEHAGKPITGSVMDYNPINVNVGDGEVQGDYTMTTIGPYDYWAIEYGYTMERDLKPILSRCTEPELIFGTDEDSWGSDPRARVFDMGRNPLNYSKSQMRLVKELRTEILERMVKDGESWAKAREAYELLLSRHMGAVNIAANWVGGDLLNRDRKGDPGQRDAVQPVPVENQREAIRFVIDNAFDDDAFGLTPELLAKMSVDKWWDAGGMNTIFEDPAWPIHDRILGIQASALTSLMNPTTLNRVYDNEFRTPADAEALTLPELLWGISDEIWQELDGNPNGRYSERQPMISSLRRNLQREHLDRLIDLSLPNPALGVAEKPVANLSTHRLRELSGKIDKLTNRRSSRLDAYTLAHLSEAKMRIDRALEAQYIYNAADLRGGGGMPFMLFGQGGGSR
ncbi:MAG: DUF5117 domain-containing protein [Planctomycetes bacterium]|nr:DUF5117 domain-containing protein [Planctomycetota bacterium]